MLIARETAEFNKTDLMEVLNCHRLMQDLAKATNQLPSSLFLSDLTFENAEVPVTGGGFADIYIGWYGNQKVAIKALRLHIESDQNEQKKCVNVSNLIPYSHLMSSNAGLRNTIKRFLSGGVYLIRVS